MASTKIDPTDLWQVTDVLVPSPLRERVNERDFRHVLIVPDAPDPVPIGESGDRVVVSHGGKYRHTATGLDNTRDSLDTYLRVMATVPLHGRRRADLAHIT